MCYRLLGLKELAGGEQLVDRALSHQHFLAKENPAEAGFSNSLKDSRRSNNNAKSGAGGHSRVFTLLGMNETVTAGAANPRG